MNYLRKKHAYLNTLLLLHSAFMLSVLKMSVKGRVGSHALNSHGNYIVVHGKSWENHGIVISNFCGNPATGPHSAVGSKSDYRFRGCELDPCPVPYFHVKRLIMK